MENTDCLTPKFTSEGPGKGKFVIESLAARYPDFTRQCKDSGLELTILKKQGSTLRPLADLPGNGDFIEATNARAMIKAVSFEFHVGSKIVDAMAFDSGKGDLILKIRPKGTIEEKVFIIPPTNIFVPSSVRSDSYKEQHGPSMAVDMSDPAPAKALQAAAPTATPTAATAATGAGGAAVGAAGSAPSGAQGAPSVVPSGNPFDNPSSNFGTTATFGNQGAGAQPAAASGIGGLLANKVVQIVGGICIAGLLIGAVFFVLGLLKNSGAPTAAPAPAPEPEQQAEVANKACSLAEAKGDDKAIITNCLASSPTAEDLNILLGEAMKQERCEIVLRILRTKGRAPEGSMYAYIYSNYADPASSYSNKCISKNQDDATYWAERAKSNQSFDQAKSEELLKAISSSK